MVAMPQMLSPRDQAIVLERAAGDTIVEIGKRHGITHQAISKIVAQAHQLVDLEICRDLVALPITSEGPLGLAAAAVAHDDLGHAARLRGAATAHGYGQQPTTSTRGSGRGSSRPPASATEPMPGTSPSAKELS
jgi:DNA-binding CsgD family transcriptional regulator